MFSVAAGFPPLCSRPFAWPFRCWVLDLVARAVCFLVRTSFIMFGESITAIFEITDRTEAR